MAVVYGSNGAGSNAAGVAGALAVTTTYPATIAANDLLIARVGGIAATSVDTLDTIAGWTKITDVGLGTTGALVSFWKLAAGTEDGTTDVFTGTYTGATGAISAIIELYTGAATTGTPVESAGTNTGSSLTPAPASVTTTTPDGLAVFHLATFSARTAGDITGETGGNYIEAYADYNPGPGRVCFETQTAALAAAGTISGGTCTLSGTGTPAWRVICFGIKSPTAAGFSLLRPSFMPHIIR